MAEFSPSRLTFARRRRSLTKRELASAAGVSVKTITSWEAGQRAPRAAVLELVSVATQYPPAFFHADPMPELAREHAFFRSRRRMRARDQDFALALGQVAIRVNAWSTATYTLPAHQVPDLGELAGHSPESAAEMVRSAWGIGARPIANMVHLLESKGVRVFALPVDSADVDAFSTWHEGTPFVFLNGGKSAERSRFDAAHELGHLAMHRSGDGTDRELERDADRFASALLMPESSVRSRGRAPARLPRLIEMKQIWNVSLLALIVRLYQLGMLTEREYRALCIQASQRGYRTSEPAGLGRHETSQIFGKVMTFERSAGRSVGDVAVAAGVSESDVRDVLGGLVPLAVPRVDGCAAPSNSSSGSSHPALRIVDSVRAQDGG